MPTFTDRDTRTLKQQKAERPKIGNGLPAILDGFEGENRIQIVNGSPRLYYKTNQGWYFTGLSKDGDAPDLPIASSTRLGLIKIGSGGTISSDGTYTATAATPAADDITGGDAAVTITTSSGNITIDAAANNSDIIFKGTDATSDITMLTLDGSEAGAATFNNKIVATELDISGNVDIDGTLESDAYTVDGTALSTYIRDIVGNNMLSSNTETGISVTYDTSNDNIDFAIAAAQTTITSIYATDLIMGEDSQTAIDFGTANEIDFKINNATELTLDASALYPVTDAGLDLGTSTLEFKDAFFDGTVTSDAFAGPLTGNVTGDVSGNAGTVTVATRSTDAWHYLLFSASTSGSLAVYDNGSIKVNPNSGTLSVPLLTISTSLTVQELLAADNLDIGSHGFRAQELYADARTSGRVAFYAANGQLQDDSDLTFATATLTATNIAAFNLTGKLTAGSTEIEGSNFDINGGVITGITDLVVADGGTGVSTFTDGGILFGNGTGAIQVSAVLAAGEILIGDGTTEPAILDVGSASAITVLGTVGTGTWQGSSIAVGYTDAKCTDASADETSANTCSRGATLTDEAIQDLVGAMTTGNTETNCTITYQDSDGTIDFITQDTNTTYTAGTGLNEVGEEFTLDLSDVITNSTNNRVITDINGDSLNAEANLTFDGSTLTCAGAATFTNTGTGASNSIWHQSNNYMYMTGGSAGLALKNATSETSGIFLTANAIALNATTSTFTGTLHVTADVIAYYSSDPTLKENKELISNPLDKIDSIGGYSFDWKESAEEYGKHLKGKDYGVMADEIADILPELVQTREDGIRAVKYDKLVPLLIEGIKELKHELDMIKGVS